MCYQEVDVDIHCLPCLGDASSEGGESLAGGVSVDAELGLVLSDGRLFSRVELLCLEQVGDVD